MKDKKRLNINIHLSNRWLYFLITLGILAIVAVGVYAAPNPGHDADELDLNGWTFSDDYLYDDGEQVIGAGDEWLRLNNDGDFTSGIYTPGLLRADGGLYVSNDEYFYRYAEDVIRTTDSFLVGGNVGIGTTSAASRLSVGGSGSSIYAVYATGSTYGVVGAGSSYGVYGNGVIGVLGIGSDLDFYAAGPGYNYYPFTGSHEVKLSDDFPDNARTGMIVSATGEVQIRENGNSISISSTLPTVQLSDSENDEKVFGVFGQIVPLMEEHWYYNKAKETDRFAVVNALGEGRVLVTNINGEIENGDYIITSNIPGYGMKQNDDLLYSYTLGKAIEDVDWENVKETVEYNGEEYKVYLIAVVYTSG